MKTQKNSVRRSLVVSATALVVSVAMLIGTTFAWFTDSVSSGTNKIVAGNLDVELEYKNTNDGNFAKVTPTTNVFKDDTLWEPGHVEYAVLKISNAGTLALKYKLAVNVVNEKAGTSVKTNAPFKLSDFLKYAVVDGDISNNTRADMVTAATPTAKKLSEGYALTDEHLSKEQSKTVTLVVWLPDNIGNEANYTGNDVPTIQMGINLVATQYTEESDSFGNTYDENADGTPDNGSLWNGTTLAQTTVPVQPSGVTTITTSDITATVPENSVDPGVTNLTLTMIQTTTPANIKVTATNANTLTYDVSLKDQNNNVVKAAENTYFTFTIQLKPNLDIVSFKHHDTPLNKVDSITGNDQFVYNDTTGELTFSTDDFSPFTAVWKFDGGKGTEDNPYLIATAEQLLGLEKEEGTFCCKLTNDITIPNEVYLSSKKVTIDLNGHSVTLDYADGVKPNNGSVFYIGGKKSELTIKDTSEAKTGTVYGSDKNYPNKVTSAVRAGNYGKLNIYGGNFVGRSEGTSCIFVYTNMSSASKATVNIYGGTFKTLTPSNGIYYVLNHQDSATAGCTMNVYGGEFYNYNPGKTNVDPVNAKTGKILLATDATTTSSSEGGDTVYTVTSTQAQ